MNELSFQLYSARNHRPWRDVFERLTALGYTGVEGYSALYDEPSALVDALADAGLQMPSAHFALAALEDDPEATCDLARALGCRTIYGPYLEVGERPTDLASWRAFAARLKRVGERTRGEGFGFGWHNHDFELVPLADGTVPLDVIFEEAPDVGWEADLAWIVRADADPLAWVRSHGERATSIHLKDVAPAGECADEGGWADFGHGTMDWETLVRELRAGEVERYWIVEHDEPSDLGRFASRAMATWRALVGTPGANA